MGPSAGTTSTPASRSELDSPERPPDGCCRIVARRGSTITEYDDPRELARLIADPDTRAWIDLVDPPEALLTTVADTLGLHPLVVEDIAERNQRAKIELIEDDLHIVLFAIAYEGQVLAHEVDLVLATDTLLSVHGPEVDLVTLPQMRLGAGALLGRGVDYLLYAVADGIVDGYFPVLDRLGDELDDLQDDVVERPTAWSLQRVFAIKRELIQLRRALSPAREILNQLTNRDLPLIAPGHVVYFRDIYDHLIRVTDELDNYRELAAGTLEVYLSTVNNNLSAIMKRLTGVTVILAGVGAVAGVFGMSEAGTALAGGEASGFWMVTALVVAAAAVTVVVLRRIDWI